MDLDRFIRIATRQAIADSPIVGVELQHTHACIAGGQSQRPHGRRDPRDPDHTAIVLRLGRAGIAFPVMGQGLFVVVSGFGSQCPPSGGGRIANLAGSSTPGEDVGGVNQAWARRS